MARKHACFAIKAAIDDLHLDRYAFANHKTMYGGKSISPGDRIFLFASENEGGCGLFARGVVLTSTATPRMPDAERQTPRVSITVERRGSAGARLGRAELRGFGDWSDGRAETELNFKLYRQATNKIVGLSEAAAAFLDRLFPA